MEERGAAYRLRLRVEVRVFPALCLAAVRQLDPYEGTR